MAPKRLRDDSMESVLRKEAASRRQSSSSSQSQMNAGDQGESSQVTKGRGTARGNAEWGSGQPLYVDFNSTWQPIGPNKEVFTSQLGIIARNGSMAPLTFTSWNAMSEHKLNAIWKEVKDNTNVPDEYRPHCLKAIGVLWRDWKARVKRDFYKPYPTDEARLTFTPPKITEEHWKILVAYWSSKGAQTQAERNKANRAHQFALHKTGRTSFAKKREEISKSGEKTDRISMFIKTRTTSGGDVVDNESAEIISQLKEEMSRIPNEQQTDAAAEQVSQDVMGRDHRGYARTYGHGPSPSVIKSQCSSQPVDVNKLHQELYELRVENKELNDYNTQLYNFLQQKFPDIEEQLPPPMRPQVSVPDASSAHQNCVNADATTANEEENEEN